MPESFIVYIDESGDEGFKFGVGGSSDWFVLSALIVRAQNDHTIRDALATVRAKLGKPEKFSLHFRNLKHQQRVVYVQALSALRIRTVTVLVHKPCLKEPETFQKYRLYRYSVRFLLERVSWLCRDEHQKSLGDGSARIFFSNRSAMSFTDLTDYVAKLIHTGDPLEVRIESAVVKPDQIETRKHEQFAGLQAADAVASSFFFAAQTHPLGITEPRYVDCLKRTVYRKDGEALGYGVKLWPKESDSVIQKTESLQWVTELFRKK